VIAGHLEQVGANGMCAVVAPHRRVGE